MNRKIKLALAALLGFSTACTSVKNADTTAVKGTSDFPRRVVVMYGVPAPRLDSARAERLKRLERPDTLPPVAERPREEDPSSGKK